MSPMVLSFLVFEAFIVLIGTLLGLKRGLGKTVIRTVYLAVIGVVAFFVSRGFIHKLADFALEMLRNLYPADLQTMIDTSIEIESLLIGFASALVFPVCFALLFGVLELFSLIGFGAISKKILSSMFPDKEKGVGSRLAGAGVGFAVSLLVAAVLTAPEFVFSSVLFSIPEDTLSSFGIPTEVVYQNETYGTTLSVKPSASVIASPLAAQRDMPEFLVVNKAFAKLLTSFETPSGEKTDAYTEIPILAHLAIGMYDAFNGTLYANGDVTDAIANAGAILSLYVDDSCFVKELATDSLRAVGVTLVNNHSIFGMEILPSEDKAFDSIINTFMDTIAHTTVETVKDNLVTLFGKPNGDLLPSDKMDTYDALDNAHITADGYHNAGIFSAFTHMNVEDTAEGSTSVLAGAFATMADSESMSLVFEEVSQYTSNIISQNSGVLLDETSKPVYDKFIEDVENAIVSSKDGTTEEKAEAVKDIVDFALSEFEIDIEDWQSSVLVTCAVREFCQGDYLDENGNPTVSIEDIMAFFGISAEDIPDWAK